MPVDHVGEGWAVVGAPASPRHDPTAVIQGQVDELVVLVVVDDREDDGLVGLDMAPAGR